VNRNNEKRFLSIPQMHTSRTRFNRDQTILTTFDSGKLIPFFVDILRKFRDIYDSRRYHGISAEYPRVPQDDSNSTAECHETGRDAKKSGNRT
jgi:hypothetical protein